MIKSLIATVACCFILNTFGSSQNFVKRIPEEITSREPIVFWFLQDDSSQLVHIRIAFVNAGSAYLPLSKSGCANLFSHLIASGSSKFSKLELRKVCSDNMINISCNTNLDIVVLSCTCPIMSLNIACEVLNDILRNLTLDEKEILEKQHSIGNSGLALHALLYSKLFPNHPYERGVEGPIDCLAKLSKKDLREYIDKFIVQSNVKLCICGPFTTSQATDTLDKIFAGVKIGQKSENAVPNVSPKMFSNIEHCYEEGPQSVILFMIPNESRLSDKRYASVLLFTLLGDSQFMRNKIISKLREDKGLIYSGDVVSLDLNNANFILGQMSTKNEQVNLVIDILKDLVKQLKQDGITSDELQNVKKNVLGTLVVALRTSEALCDFYFYAMLAGLKPDVLRKMDEGIKNVSLSDVNQLAKDLLNENELSIIVVGGNPQ